MPAGPPIRERATLSVTNCRDNCQRDAPSEARTATSAGARSWARSRLATLAQGDQEDEADAAHQQPQAVFTSGGEEVVLERLGAGAPALFDLGPGLADVARDGGPLSGLGRFMVTPGLRRPMTRSQWKSWLICSGLKVSGVHKLVGHASLLPEASRPPLCRARH